VFQLITDNEPLPPGLRKAAIAIGNFDGMHLGHQAVIERVVEIARGQKCPALALTFEPHPRSFFTPDAPVFRLTGLPEKALLLEALGLDGAIVKNFNAQLAAMEPQEFFYALLSRELQVAHLVVGEGFHFGKNRAGSPELLRKLAQDASMGTTFIAPQRDEAGVISSSRIREALAAGNIEVANGLLGYRWFVTGEVMHGDKRGRALGVPTANIALPENFGLKHGVYAGRACVDDFWFGAALHFGTRLQFGGGAALLEAHLLDFSGELYGKILRVEFMQYLRAEQKFEDSAALARQMQADIDQARKAVTAFVRKPQSSLQSRLDQACTTFKDA
jgi:riboflavin kinase/FMN adenylyltransferase